MPEEIALKTDEFREAPLIDRIKIILDEEQEGRLNHWIDSKKEAISFDRTGFINRQLKYLDNYDDFISNIRKGLWEGQSNIHLPFTEVMVKSYHARLYNLFTDPNSVTYEPREFFDKNLVEYMKRLRKWYIWDYINGFKGIKGVYKEVFFDCVTIGYGILMKNWEFKQRKIIEVIENAAELMREAKEINAMAEETEAGENQLDISPFKETQKIVTTFEGTRLQSMPFENVWFPNDIPLSSDLNHPEMVMVSTEMHMSDIMLKGHQDEWNMGRCEEVKNEHKYRHGQAGPGTNHEVQVKERRDRLTGYEGEHSYYSSDKRDIEYCFCTYDIDEDGVAEELIVTRSARGTILKVGFLDRISRSGKRPLYKFDCFSKPRQAYSRGIVEFMYSLQDAINMNHNLRMDYLQLQTMPFGAYRAASSLNNQPIRLAPGKWIPVDDVSADIRPLNFSSSVAPLAQEEARYWQYGERLATVSPLSQGMMPDTVGAARSTSGVTTMLGQMDKEFKPVVDSIADTVREVEYGLLEDLDYRVDPELKRETLGASVDKDVTTQFFAQNFILTKTLQMSINVADLLTSPEVKRQNSQILLGIFQQPGLLQQFGIITPRGLYQAAIDLVRSYDIEHQYYLDKPQFAETSLNLYQEIQVIYQGEVPPMNMQDNHQEKIQGLSAYLQTPEHQTAVAKGFTAPNVEDVFRAAIQKHMQLEKVLTQVQGGGQPGQPGSNQNAVGAGMADQQGGPNPNQTTSRELRGATGPQGPQGKPGGDGGNQSAG